MGPLSRWGVTLAHGEVAPKRLGIPTARPSSLLGSKPPPCAGNGAKKLTCALVEEALGPQHMGAAP